MTNIIIKRVFLFTLITLPWLCNAQLPTSDYVFFNFSGITSGNALISSGSPNPFPVLTINGNTILLWSVQNHLYISEFGNPTERIYNNAIIDDMMRLDDLNSTNKCKYFATHITRHTLQTAFSGNERIFQYGDQGSQTGQTGGWVARINSGNTAPFLSKSISFAIHTPDIGIPKPGGQSNPTFPDPIATTVVLTDSQWENGIDLLFGVDNSVSPYVARIYIDGVLVVSDVQSDLTWPLPGVSNNGPGTDASSNGFTLFAQSTNEGTSPLKDAEIRYIWIGKCTDTQELNNIAQALHLNTLAVNTVANNLDQVKVFPNPTNGILIINGIDNNVENQILIYNALGNLVKEVELSVNGQIDVSMLPNGVYFICFKNYINKVYKFVKQ